MKHNTIHYKIKHLEKHFRTFVRGGEKYDKKS